MLLKKNEITIIEAVSIRWEGKKGFYREETTNAPNVAMELYLLTLKFELNKWYEESMIEIHANFMTINKTHPSIVISN